MAWRLSQVLFEQPHDRAGNRRPTNPNPGQRNDDEMSAAEMVRPKALPGIVNTFVDLFCAASIFNRKRR